MDASRPHFRFGRYMLKPTQRQLLCDGVPVKLGARAFDVLQALVEERQRHLSKSELIERVWPDVVVEENNLEVHVWALRKLLGAQAITTIPGRGYRFALPLEGEAGASAPAVVTEPLRRGALPQRLPPLIGRDADLSALRHAVDEHPLVTVIGVGGIGKSLLAQHLLALERDHRPHGVCWIDLASLADPALVCAAIAGALGLALGGGDQHRALAAATAPLKLLMVLDNAEQLVAEVAAVVSALLQGAPALHIVVTSQVPLKLAQERLVRLGPLAAPESLPAPSEAMTFGAVALFAERVSALQPRFALDDANVAAVCSLCRRLDGSPLAIELAAARVPLLGVHGLEQGLDQRLQLLTKGHRDAPARQHTLRAALEWTVALLGVDEQRAFRRLAVFAGSFTLEAAQQVAADHELDRWRLLAALDALVDHSLVAVIDGEPPRYRLLESPLALAREQLAESGEGPTLHERHARAMHELFLAVNHEFLDDRLRRDQMLDRLAPDLDNGRGAMAWALQHDATLAVALVTPLTNAFGRMRGAEGRALWPATEPLLRDDMPIAVRLVWTLGAAMFYYTEFQNARCCAFARRAVELARQCGDRRRLALALGMIGAGDDSATPDERRVAIEEMRALQREGAPLLSRINGAQAEFIHAQRAGEIDQAEAAARRWLELTRAPGWEYDRGVAMSNLADLVLARGDVTGAVALGRELEAQLCETRHLRSLAVARANLTIALLAADEPAEARRVAEAGWPMAASWRLQPYWGVALSLLAALEARPRAAAALLGYAHARLAGAGLTVEANEARTLARAQALAVAALGEAVCTALQDIGRQWADERAGAVALDTRDLP